MSQKFNIANTKPPILVGNDIQGSLEKYFLRQGQIFVTKVPTEVITILGSCVSVCLWDRYLKIGGMNHFLLSHNAVVQNLSQGEFATKALVKAMLQQKCQLANMEAKIFGGSSCLQQFEVGKGNIDIAFKVLRNEGIPITASHTAGAYGRKIIFRTDTGSVLMGVLKNL